MSSLATAAAKFLRMTGIGNVSHFVLSSSILRSIKNILLTSITFASISICVFLFIFAYTTTTPTYPLTRPGDAGEDVFSTELMLQAHGFSFSTNGSFGPPQDRVFEFDTSILSDGMVKFVILGTLERDTASGQTEKSCVT